MFAYSKWLAVVRGPHWVVAKIKGRGKNIKILRLCETELKGDKDEQTVQLKAWLKKEKIAVKNLKLAVSLPGVVTRIITLPILKAKDLKRLLTEQIDQYFTLNVEDYLVDYRVVDHFEQNGQKLQHVLLAALPKREWSSLWEVWAAVGIKPKVVDLAADCLSRFYAYLDEQAQRGAGIRAPKAPQAAEDTDVAGVRNFHRKRDLAILDLSAERIEIILLEAGRFFLYSDLPFDIHGNQGVSMWNTLLSLQTSGGGGEGQAVSDSGTTEQEGPVDIGDFTYEELESAFTPVFRTLGEFFNFFSARHFGKSIDQVFLTGEYAAQSHIKDVFRNNLDVEVEVGFPAGWQPKIAPRFGKLRKSLLKYGSLYGLVMRED